ncbi:MAG: response regulator transcription factor [Oleibacter sp.]|nr:response regulator transcription factor [Thalassolituus sp.]
MTESKHFIIADDHPLFRAALQQAVSSLAPDCTIREAESLSGLQDELEDSGKADLILLDLNMPGANGFSGLIFIRSHYPHIPVVVVSACEDANVMRQAIEYEAAGYIAKSSSLDDISTALQFVLDGNIYLPEKARQHVYAIQPKDKDLAERLASLTPQQFRVLSMMTEGMLNKQIAYDLTVSEATVKAHVTAIFRKLGVRTRTQAVIAVQALDIERSDTNQTIA